MTVPATAPRPADDGAPAPAGRTAATPATGDAPAGAEVLERQRLRHPLAVRHLRVLRTTRLSDRLLRITAGGDSLAGFTAPGPADHVKLFVPDPVTGELHAPTAGPDGLVRPATPPTVRDYTPRAVRPGELDLDVVLHEGPGPVSAWAAAARPGDALAVAGPRGSKLPPAGAAHVLLGGDETALPALARWLEALPADLPVDVLLEVADPADAGYLEGSTTPGTRLHVLARGGAAPGTTTLLAEAARALPPRPGPGFAWFAGEAGSLVPLRRWLRHDSPFHRGNVAVDGYWKRGVVALDHHAPIDPADPDE
ncbi:siderophore-interacting protein [Georgenia sp. TF02-10]|uniref:siderophore-interacting protein n=1 Tax=Georgenia sp. TF02-10 TaxID=2917725 RepID=UPI001FA7F840|nr:siderophore-interacting protein [Georgenia sp. TF02-10]UNX56172.1 siderophore-interacting protein [Georgenia sp. TF02-10]